MVSSDNQDRIKESVRKSRIRSRAQWAFVLAAIGFAGAITGLVQYLNSGVVSIRPGMDGMSGTEALELLITLILVSLGFFSYGLYLFIKIRR